MRIPFKKPAEERKILTMFDVILELIYGMLMGGVIFACLIFILLAAQDLSMVYQKSAFKSLSEITVFYQLLGICSIIIIVNCIRTIICSYIKIVGVSLGIILILYWFNTIFIPNLFKAI